LYNYTKLSKRIKKNEGFKNYIYYDQLGYKTIGYGHLIRNSDKFRLNKKYSKKILTNTFNNDLKKAIINFRKNYNYKLPPNVQEVIIEMIFQLGIRGLLKFKKFNLHIKKKQYYLAALEMLKSRWYNQTPKRVSGLIKILLKNAT